jgi:hypothetical protein
VIIIIKILRIDGTNLVIDKIVADSAKLVGKNNPIASDVNKQ